MSDKLYIGVDVSKGWIDVAMHGKPSPPTPTQAAAQHGRRHRRLAR